MHQSRLFGVTSADAAKAIMLKGDELGLGLAASFEFVQVVLGKAALSPRGCLALIHLSKLVEVQIRRSDDMACTVWMKRKDTGFEFELTWTMQDAVKAGVVKPDSGWDHYPANMLRWRTVGFVADVVCPDLIGGLKRADELGAAIDPNGDVIEGSFKVESVEAPRIEAKAAVTLKDLLALSSPEHIMELNEGRIPASDEEVAAVEAALEKEREG
jgi:hypothetical protein